MTEKIGKPDTASPLAAVYRHRDGVVPNTVAIAYALMGYGGALWLLAQTGVLYVVGIVLLAHSLVVVAYLLHECVHGSLFPTHSPLHQRLGLLLAWVTGACYGSFEKLRTKHLRHHFERADIVAIDYRRVLDRHPRLKAVVLAGQRCGLPAVELLMHGLAMARPFGARGAAADRRHVLVVAAVRLLFFVVMTALTGWAWLLGYAGAYVIFLTVLAFMDAFQHQYLLLEALDDSPSRSPVRDKSRFPGDYFNRDYEDARTFSNLISARFPVFNLLVLNFCYHNVHHRQPAEPWYRLPHLHRDMVARGECVEQVVPLIRQLRNFVRYRSTRVMTPASDEAHTVNVGAAGVSFLTPL